MSCISFPSITDIDKIFLDIGDILPSFTKVFYIPKQLLQAIWRELYGELKSIEEIYNALVPPWLTNFSILDSNSHTFSYYVDKSLSALMSAAATIKQQFIMLFQATIGKLIKFIKDFGLSLINFDLIPPFNISISDLLSGNFSIKNLLKQIEKMAIDEINAFLSLIPSLPEMWSDIKNIAIKIVTAIQSYITNMFKGFIDYIMKLLKPIVDFINTLSFGTFTLLTIPDFPSLEQIMTMVKNLIAQGITDILEIFNNILNSLPGFSLIKSLLNLPNPLLPNLNWPTFTFTFSLDQFYTKIYTFVFEQIIDFILSLPIIGDIIKQVISVIKLVNWFGSYIINTICHPQLQDPFPNNKIENLKT